MVDDAHQKLALGVVVAFPVLGGIAVLLRIWSRYLTRSRLGADDILIVVGYILAIGQSITSWYYIKTNYVGIHIWDIPKDYDIKQGLIWNFANQLIYNPCLTMVKLSILMFLRRLESQSRLVNSLIWSTMFITVALFIAVLFVDIFQCSPVAYVYDFSISKGSCINQGAFYVATAATYLFTDLLVLSIPIIITWGLHMPLRRKVAVCVVLCMGAVATGVGVWRIVLLAKGFFPTHPVYDATYSIGFCSSAVEVHVAVLAACAPCLKAIASTYLPRLLGSSRRATYPSTGRQYVPTSTTSYSRRSHVKISAARGDASVAFEMVTPQLPIPGAEEAAHKREMRKYHPYAEADDTSLSSEDGAPTTGIVKTTAISVRYTADSNLESGGEGTREGSVERLV
ncbi:hypothetical protein AnigIFM60653_010809 [Aspergillus niger]|uniref:Rhodopsin domain-containing protein n=1 Tax=Aspergillus welwitschiae TaxID=1341132 RepID=A0A3F3PM62_9EURO|nr:hypothetical protein BDQ94DRAFT_184122 [Aspergillus welwitschiae]RDH28011.1 hypothetical protein BDQ94DRAFT_184122 [Aspergillus welwitschiae]GLA09005.1 hypothetical protein AnigIFM60653_010809 [Aspergillus niger]